MNRYILTFNKKGYMRFISHLDLQTLFHRAIKRGEVDVAYSNGYNPHELMNIVSPLSLGYESEAELLELDTMSSYDCNDLIKRLNLVLPEGIKFIACKEVERQNKSTSCHIESAIYSVSFKDSQTAHKLNIKEFLAQDIINILKHDKKTKKMVEKDVKNMIGDITLDGDNVILNVSCGSNATLNPSNLLKSLLEFSGIEYKAEECHITRIKLIDAK